MGSTQGKYIVNDLESVVLTICSVSSAKALATILAENSGEVYDQLRGRARVSNRLIRKLKRKFGAPRLIRRLRAEQACWDKFHGKPRLKIRVKHDLMRRIFKSCRLSLSKFAKKLNRNETFLTEVFSGRKTFSENLLILISSKFPRLPEALVRDLRARVETDSAKRHAAKERRKSAAAMVKGGKLLNVSALARELGLPPQRFCAIVQGRYRFTPEIICRIEERFPREAKRLVALIEKTRKELTDVVICLSNQSGRVSPGELARRMGYSEKYLLNALVEKQSIRRAFWVRLHRLEPYLEVKIERHFRRRK